ncbi:MAG: hypothetical protein MK116_12890 [Phycisphaerales bacterium]|nr:hypothetical protein [Phycisphaerales bacterium]
MSTTTTLRGGDPLHGQFFDEECEPTGDKARANRKIETDADIHPANTGIQS